MSSSEKKKHPIIVIKLGTSSIVDEKTHQPLLSNLALIVETATSLRRNGYKVILVSSGAIGIALHQIGLARRPKHLPQVQALAAIGQCRLMGLWDQLFDRIGQTVAQVLLTRNDIADRTQYLNAQNTFGELLNMGVVPIVNENDTLSVTEIKFGDNDTLSAITAGMVGADYLFLMTDVDCLYDKNPRAFPDAKPIEVVENIASLDVDVSSAGSALGTGGMSTKIVAARLATAAGVTTIITRSSRPGSIFEIVEYVEGLKKTQGTATSSAPTAPPLHTRFLPSTQPIRDRHFWLLHGLTPHGTLYIDQGARHALASHAGLLPVGIVDVDGSFAQQECVRLVQVTRRPTSRGGSSHAQNQPTTSSSNSTPTTPSTSANTHASASASATTTSQPFRAQTPPIGQEIGRALVNYSAAEIRRIAGIRSTEIASILGYADSEYVALRENVAMFEWGTSRPTTPNTGLAMGAGSLDSRRNGEDEEAADTLEGSDMGRYSRTRLTLGLGGYVGG